MTTCNALVQANNPRVGDWQLKYEWIPTGSSDDGRLTYIRPGLKITAKHQQTGEVQSTSISGEALHCLQLCENPFEKAFKAIGIWEAMRKGSLRRDLISSRKPQGWPLYSQRIIPRLYEFLAPYYSNPGHYSERRDVPDQRRKALFDKELLEDMLDILRTEHPQVFAQTTLNQLKASIQRHLASRETVSIKSADKLQIEPDSTSVTQ